MRRSEREIRSLEEIVRILSRERVVRIGFAVHDEAYVVPLSYGYDPEAHALYVHTAHGGKKVDCARANPRVCFEVEGPATLRRGDRACTYGLAYESVIGWGTLEEVTDPEGKMRALSCLMRQQAGVETAWRFDGPSLAAACVWRLQIASVTGKRAP